MNSDRLRDLPSVDKVISAEEMAGLPHSHAVAGARLALEEARARNGEMPASLIAARAAEIARSLATPSFRPAVNASGTILNTGLGRARLAPAAMEAVRNVAAAHSVLELDLESGRRGSRQAALSKLLRDLTGAEAGIVVNNNAAAVMLAINTLAAGMKVLLSRGQSVEIGGAFRMPDVVRASGADLVDVGCTNKTRASDYAKAIDDDTAVILRCHPSNFSIQGFTEEADPRELAQLAGEAGLHLIDDVGSGCLVRTEDYGLPHEPTIRESLEAGADVVTASGDKLLGGPQAGLILGKADAIEQIAKNPIARALRIDKLTAAALEATLRLYVEGREDEIPTIRYLSRPSSEIESLATSLVKKLKAESVDSASADGTCEPGGGSLPGVTLPSCRVSLSGDPEETAKRMRLADPPVIGYIEKGTFWLDMRTVDEDELPLIVQAATQA